MKNVLLLIVGLGLLAAGLQTSAQDLLATTNQGELVEIDLAAGTATLIGDAGTFNGKDMGWTDLSFDAAGDLFAISRIFSEPETGCPQGFGTQSKCTHYYQLDPTNGAVLTEIGNTGATHISDIDFAPDGTLYGNQWHGRGALNTINPGTALANIVGDACVNDFSSFEDCHFGHVEINPFPFLSFRRLENGGLSIHPITGEIWAVERSRNSFVASIFRVDPSTGAAIPPIVDLGLLGTPLTIGFGFDGLEILPDGRFIATRAFESSEVYEINPDPDATSGLAEITFIPLLLDAGITGDLTGLESLPTPSVLLGSLINDVLMVNITQGLANSLDPKIDTALHALDDTNQNNDVAAVNAMNAFINSVQAQRGNQISEADADLLIANAQTIIDLLNP